MRLLPDQLYTIDLADLLDMLIAYRKQENQQFEKDMTKLSWIAAIVMNSSGRYKKHIKPTDLYKIQNTDSTAEKKPTKNKEELQAELRSTFGV